MRKLFSIGALLAASALCLWQPQPVMARDNVGVTVYYHHHHRYHHHHYRHGYYYYR